jgi:sensor domain CHASE-containing protein
MSTSAKREGIVFGAVLAMLVGVVLLVQIVIADARQQQQYAAAERDRIGRALNETQQQLTLVQSQLYTERALICPMPAAHQPTQGKRRRIRRFDTSFYEFVRR